MKTLIVTGSASGIGFEIAKYFLEREYRVVFSDLNKEALDKTLATFTDSKYSSNCFGVVCDVANEEDVKNLVQKSHSHFGSIDVFINNAGLQYVANIEDFPTSKFKQMIDVMLVGSFLCSKAVVPIMKRQQFGRIINMASINGLIGFAGKAAYNSAKHGIIGLTKVIALECAAHGITANAICPGYIDTPLVRGQMQDLAKTRGVSLEQVLDEVLFPLIPQKKLVDIADVAALAFFLAQDCAKNITGTNMIIDGGYTAQ